MALISVSTDKIINYSQDIVKIAKRVKQLEYELNGIKLKEYHVEKTMKKIAGSVSNDVLKIGSMGNALDDIAKKYRETEKALLNQKAEMASKKKKDSTGKDKRNVFEKFWDWLTKKDPDKYDTTTLEQEKAADLAMKKEIWDVLQKEKYSRENWEKASVEERKKILQDYMDELIEIYGLQDVKRKIKWDDDLTYTSSSVTLGQYNHGFHRVTLNEKMLSDDIAVWDSYSLLGTVSHELRHAYQHEAVDNPTDFMVSKETIDKWDKNFDNYIDSDDYEKYRNQPVEVDARDFEIDRDTKRPK